MKSKSIKYVAVLFLLLGIFAYIIDQTIDEGIYYHSQRDYQVNAATLSYNPAIDQQQNMAIKQKLALLNNIQMYDFLAKSLQVKEPGALANALVSFNNKSNVVPVEKEKVQFITRENAICRLLENKQRNSIPDAQSVYQAYKYQFNDSLKLSLTQKQLNDIWQSLDCAKKP